MEWIFEPGTWWSYLAVFLAAATPVLEVVVVIPAAIVAGMPPVGTTLVALAGNLSTVVAVVLIGDRLREWWRRGRPLRAPSRPASGRRALRAGRLAQRWGVPGLAFIAPVTTGTHIAAVAALATGAARGRVLAWMTGGLVVWGAAVAVAAAFGAEALW